MTGATERPLEGIRVLEIAAYISGPYTGALLAALGAEVVKVEPREGDAFRIGQGNSSPFFIQYNSGKKSVAVDLKAKAGLAAVRALIPQTDVLIENMRPGKLASLGVGPDECRQLNSQLVYASISGFGNGGAMRDRPSYDTIGQAFSGYLSIMNEPGNVSLTGTCVADLITGVSSALGIVASLLARERNPKRRAMRIETSVHEAMSTLTIDALTQASYFDIDPVRETRHPQAQTFCLKTASGDYLVMHLSSSEKFWRALARTAGRQDLIEDPRFRTYDDRVVPEHYRAIRAALSAAFLTRTREEWMELLARADVPFAPALTTREVAAHPQTRWLELLTSHPNGHVQVQPPWRLDGTRPVRDMHAPTIGEHTREVFGRVLSTQQLEELFADGIVFESRPAA